jgi:benzoyl-CoA reductase/2-hydroxyglutaryl-CoA dehydratase subunit BcrC/BadD/HgdB
MSSLKILKELLDYYYSPDDPGTAWISVFTPSELLTSMDLRCFYPENAAATLSGSNKNTELIDHSRSEGYSGNICSYALLYAARSKQASKYRRVPEPGLLATANNQCGTLLYWWESFKKEYGLPIHFINYPKCEGEFSAEERKYIASQYTQLIEAAEARFGKRFNEERLGTVIENSLRANKLWKEIQLLRKTNYIPPRVFTETLLPMVIAKGDARTGDYYEELLDEIRLEYSGNTLKKRILWLGYPFWFLKGKYPRLNDDAGIVMDIYTSHWILDYSGESMMDKLVNAYGKMFMNMSLDWKIKYVEGIVSEYAIDGVITHLNKSCKRDSIGLFLVNQHLNEKLGVPTLVIESDMANPDWYNSENIELNIEAFLELL